MKSGRRRRITPQFLLSHLPRGDPVPFFFTGIFFSNMTVYMGPVFKEPLSALRTQTILSDYSGSSAHLGRSLAQIDRSSAHQYLIRTSAQYFGGLPPPNPWIPHGIRDYRIDIPLSRAAALISDTFVLNYGLSELNAY